jgi:hypothetical protein
MCGNTHRICLVTEEMNLFETLILHVLQGISLIPTGGEYVKRDLSSDGECEAVGWELLLKCLDKFGAYLVFIVISLEVKTFLNPGER